LNKRSSPTSRHSTTAGVSEMHMRAVVGSLSVLTHGADVS
jgi:hypothetical protein